MDTNTIKDILVSSAATRRNFLKVAALAGAGVALGSQAAPFKAQAATDDPSTIIGVALTAEFLAVTTITNVLNNAAALGLNAATTTTFQAILAEEAIHVRYLQAYGATPAYGTDAQAAFSYPSGAKTFTDVPTLANTLVLLESAFVAAYMAATREFAADARADLAQLTYQIGAVEAEHRTLARVVGGFVPYSDLAFQSNLLPSVVAGATFLSNQGFLTPTAGNTYNYFDVLTANAISSYSHLLLQTTP